MEEKDNRFSEEDPLTVSMKEIIKKVSMPIVEFPNEILPHMSEEIFKQLPPDMKKLFSGLVPANFILNMPSSEFAGLSFPKLDLPKIDYPKLDFMPKELLNSLVTAQHL